jgi:hypothetical protein
VTLRLPLLVERVISDTRALQTQTAQEHEQKLHRQDFMFSCRVGCAYCCHHPFLVTVVEGLILYRWLASHGRWTATLRKRVQEARDKTLGLSFEVWLLSNMPCPLLDSNKKCSAYEARPLHCRTTYSASDPILCHPHDPMALTRILPNTEAIVDFNNQVKASLKKLGGLGAIMPLGEALLLGEAIETETLRLEEAGTQLAKDLLG